MFWEGRSFAYARIPSPPGNSAPSHRLNGMLFDRESDFPHHGGELAAVVPVGAGYDYHVLVLHFVGDSEFQPT